jgi:hypothetical protein
MLLSRQSLALRVRRPLFHGWRQPDTLNGANLAEAVAANDKAPFFFAFVPACLGFDMR